MNLKKTEVILENFYSLNFIAQKSNRLDVAILEYLDAKNSRKLTRNKVQNFIENTGVSVNEKPVFKSNIKLNRGDEISLEWIDEVQELDKNLVSCIKVVDKNENFILVNKPPGLVVHSGAGHEGDTLADWLAQNYLDQMQMKNKTDPNDKHIEPHLGGGMVHRLDKDTQGLMLVARSFEALRFFQDQFRSRTVSKKYLAILNNKLDSEVILKGFQARTRKNVLKQFFTLQDVENPEILAKISKAVPIKGYFRTSESKFTPLYYCDELNLTLAEVEIFTGRMHQIRTQAEFLNTSVFQDPLYKIPSEFNLQSLQEKYPDRIDLNVVSVRNIEKSEFLELQNKIFGFPDRFSFFLQANFLKFKDLEGIERSYELTPTSLLV